MYLMCNKLRINCFRWTSHLLYSFENCKTKAHFGRTFSLVALRFSISKMRVIRVENSFSCKTMIVSTKHKLERVVMLFVVSAHSLNTLQSIATEVEY